MKTNDPTQGEPLTSILIAKIAWLRNPALANTPCEAELAIPRPKNPEGTAWKHETAEAFANEELAAWENRETPCALQTSLPTITDTEIRLKLKVTPTCMRRQINDAIGGMIKNSNMGSSDLKCVETQTFKSSGEWDVNVRELVRILYMGSGGRQPILDPATIDFMYWNLLSARGKVGDDSYSQLTDCSNPAGDELGSPEDTADRHAWYNEFFESLGDAFHWFATFMFKLTVASLVHTVGVLGAPFFIAAGHDPTELILPHWDIRVAETENHRLMIESSRYLTNAAIIRYLEKIDYEHVDEIKEDQESVRTWLLLKLQAITFNDFIEYNSRPYTRYSLNAIANLYDFAGDDIQMKTAAQIVLDLSEAKFAAGSNRGRRIAPFRRRSNNDGSEGPYSDLYYKSDLEVARAMVLAGQTQLQPKGLSKESIGQTLVNVSVSSYRLPLQILEAAVERMGTRVQRVRHDAIEVYFQSPAFTVSAGGTKSGATASVLGFDDEIDYGVAMPTVIIPTLAGTTIHDLFLFQGVGQKNNRTENLCVWKGFAGGIQPQKPEKFRPCLDPMSTSTFDLFFVNSAKCFPSIQDRVWIQPRSVGPHFYLAGKTGECDGTFCGTGRQWGIMEIVEAPDAIPENDPLFTQFKISRQSALQASTPDGNGKGVYVNVAGEVIEYTVNELRPEIVTINGNPPPEYETAGDVLTSDRKGKATIRGPVTGTKIEIDFTDWSDPKRVP